jgi:hypothetical protein
MEEKNKDPDLRIVLSSFKEEAKAMVRPFAWIARTTWNFKLIVVSCAIVGAAAGLIFRFTQKKYYKSSACFSHERLSNDYCFEMTKSLAELVDNPGNYAHLAKQLGLDQSIVQNIRSITYAPLNLSLDKFYKDSSNVKLPFKLEVETYDNSIFDSLQAGLLRYYESNAYAQELKNVDAQLLKQKEERIKEELKEIDSLKLIVSKSIIPRSTGNGIILGEPVNPMSLYNSSNFLSDKQTEVKRKEILNRSFYLIVGFSENAKPAGLGKLIFLVLGGCLGWIIGLIVVAVRTK